MLNVICSKISPWDCWCWGSPWGQGWSQNSNQRVQIKKVHPPRWSAWKTEGVRCLIGFLSGCLGCGARGQMCFSIRISEWNIYRIWGLNEVANSWLKCMLKTYWSYHEKIFFQNFKKYRKTQGKNSIIKAKNSKTQGFGKSTRFNCCLIY